LPVATVAHRGNAALKRVRRLHQLAQHVLVNLDKGARVYADFLRVNSDGVWG
jgi:hypothetical protein